MVVHHQPAVPTPQRTLLLYPPVVLLEHKMRPVSQEKFLQAANLLKVGHRQRMVRHLSTVHHPLMALPQVKAHLHWVKVRKLHPTL